MYAVYVLGQMSFLRGVCSLTMFFPVQEVLSTCTTLVGVVSRAYKTQDQCLCLKSRV